MALTLTPTISPAPYSPNVSWNNSWITVENDQNRPLFAQATYVTNNNQTNELLTALINEIRQRPDDNGFDFIDDSEVHIGNYQTLKVVADCKIAQLTADNSTIGNLSAYELPQDFELDGQIISFQLEYGAVLAYKTVDLSRYPNSMLSFNNKALVSILEGQSIITFEG
jgi:hypothetical protein